MKVADYQLDEILDIVSKADDVKNALQVACTANPIVKFYVHLACSDLWIDFDLEDLDYKFSEFHRSMCGAYLLSRSVVNIIKEIIFYDKALKKSKIFHTKNLLELLSPAEAKVFEAILKKNIPELYPTITHQMMVEIE